MTVEQIAQWARALNPKLIAAEASPVHVASVIEAARQHILTLTAPKKPARKAPQQDTTLHVFKAAHFKAAALKGSTPEKLIAAQMAAMKRSASAAPRRIFPTHADALKSTSEYVHAYYAANDIGSRAHVDKLFQPLSTAPTTWPDETLTDLAATA